MNFDHMPELHWMLGYPMAVGLMVFSSLGALVFFKKSGWL
jgi:magnesium transporter